MPKVFDDGVLRIEQVAAGRGHKYKVYDYGKNAESTYPSVTTLLNRVIAKPGLVPWAENRAVMVMADEMRVWTGHAIDDDLVSNVVVAGVDELKQSSSESVKGSELHAAIANWIDHQVVDEEWEPELEALITWLDNTGLRVVDCEMPVADILSGVGGTYDLLAQTPDDKYVLIDFKRAKNVYPENAIQLAAYGAMLWHIRGITVDALFVLQFRTQEGDPFLRAHGVSEPLNAKIAWAKARDFALELDGKTLLSPIGDVE